MLSGNGKIVTGPEPVSASIALRLRLAFGAVAATTLIASGAAIWAFRAVNTTFNTVSTQSFPATAAAARLRVNSQELAATLAELAAAGTPEMRHAARTRLNGIITQGYKVEGFVESAWKLLAEGTVGRRVRIDGELVPGTLSRRDKPCEFRFKVRANGKQLDIHYPQCVIPDTFRDVPEGGVMVTAEGKLTEAGHFDASLILAKCSSKYDPKTHSMSEKKPGAVDAM